MKKVTLFYQNEISESGKHLKEGTIEHHQHLIAIEDGEPLLVMLDQLIRYAKSYIVMAGTPLRSEPILARKWIAAAWATRRMLDWPGALAMADMRTGYDSKSNSVIESLYWKACEIAGFSEEEAEMGEVRE